MVVSSLVMKWSNVYVISAGCLSNAFFFFFYFAYLNISPNADMLPSNLNIVIPAVSGRRHLAEQRCPEHPDHQQVCIYIYSMSTSQPSTASSRTPTCPSSSWTVTSRWEERLMTWSEEWVRSQSQEADMTTDIWPLATAALQQSI